MRSEASKIVGLAVVAAMAFGRNRLYMLLCVVEFAYEAARDSEVVVTWSL